VGFVADHDCVCGGQHCWIVGRVEPTSEHFADVGVAEIIDVAGTGVERRNSGGDHIEADSG
jgi:hypothetical protein